MMTVRRLFFLCSLLAVPLLLVVGRVGAQCTGYTITGTNVNLLSPTDAAAQGAVTGTMTIKANATDSQGNPGVRSHNITVTAGTSLTLTWSSNNAMSAQTTEFLGNGSQIGPYSQSLSGSYTWTNGAADIGKTYTWIYNPTGSSGSSQDRVTVTTVSGTAGTIVSQDHVHTNAYYQLVSNFGGGSMMNNCGECQGGEIQKCLLATHTPLFDASLTNSNSGETQTLSNIQAGNVAKAQESVSGTASIMISVLPGDSPTGSTTNKIYCTMFGWVMAQQWSPGVPDFEWAVTEGETIPNTCALTLRFFETGDTWGVQCNVAWKKPPATADRCSLASQIPDFNPGAVWSVNYCHDLANCNTSDLPPPNGTNTNFPKYWYEASSGIRIGGPPAPGQPDPIINGGAHNWVFPVYVAKGYIPGGPDEDWWILDLLNIAVAKGTGLPIDCTNRDKGTRPIQSPW